MNKKFYPFAIRLPILFFLFLVFLGMEVHAQVKNQCYVCHLDNEDEPALKFKNDIHYAKNILCSDCHGGDPSQEDMDASMDKMKGYIGAPRKDAITDVCLHCHENESKMRSFGSLIDTKPFTAFRESVHGNSEIATCITCHGVHEIRSVKDPFSPLYPTRQVETCAKCHSNAAYMKRFSPSLPTDQLEKYWTSVHGKKLKEGDTRVATCADCHGSHDIFPLTDPRSKAYATNVPSTCAKCHSDVTLMKAYRLPYDAYDKYVGSVHGKALLERGDLGAPACNDCHGNHGATPPGVSSINFICGNCHAFNAEYLEKSPHAKAFAENEIHQCAACHDHHAIKHPTDEMLHVGKGAICEECHAEGDKGFITANQMYVTLKSLLEQKAKAETLLKEAEHKGMDVEDARYKFKDVEQTMIKIRTLTHSVDLTRIKAESEPALSLTDEISTAARNAIKEYAFRRKGLAVSTLFITLLALGLYLKIRSMEKSQ